MINIQRGTALYYHNINGAFAKLPAKIQAIYATAPLNATPIII
jgi:hypothetical protein